MPCKPKPVQANLTKPRYVLTAKGPVLKLPGRNLTMQEMRDWAIANAIAEVDRQQLARQQATT